METRSFFGQSGLTSTSANHFANLAKEVVRKLKTYLESLKFYSTNISIIGSPTNGTINVGNSVEEFKTIKSSLESIAKLNSLIAFFREAIKEKERLTKEAKEWEDDEVRKAYDIHYHEIYQTQPHKATYLTEEEVIESWSIGEQEKFLSLEAEAAVLGKFIHEDGALSNARVDLMHKISHPISVNENGRDTIIYNYTPTASQEVVDELFFELQTKHRKIQAELNGMKKTIEDTITQHNIKVDNDYRLALQEFNAKKSKLDDEMQEIVEAENKKRQEMLLEVQALKIVVPNRLKDIFEELQKL